MSPLSDSNLNELRELDYLSRVQLDYLRKQLEGAFVEVIRLSHQVALKVNDFECMHATDGFRHFLEVFDFVVAQVERAQLPQVSDFLHSGQ